MNTDLKFTTAFAFPLCLALLHENAFGDSAEEREIFEKGLKVSPVNHQTEKKRMDAKSRGWGEMGDNRFSKITPC